MAEINKDEIEELDSPELVEDLNTSSEEESKEEENDQPETEEKKSTETEELETLGEDLVDNDNFIEPEVDTNEFVGEDPDAIRECKGMFIRIPASNFTQNEKYCDEYLKSKGLFKED